MCIGGTISYTLNLNTGERITRVNAHMDSTPRLRWIGFETLQPATYALGDATNIESYPATHSFAPEGPITQIEIANSYQIVKYMRFSHDRCSCVTV